MSIKETMAQNRNTVKISLVIADVDGTLLTDDKTLTPRARNAVRALHEAGIAFAITSGRPPRGMAMLIEPLQLWTPIAGFNGGIFVTPHMKVIEEHVLEPEAAQHAVEIILRSQADAWVYTGTEWLVRNPDAPHVAHEQSVVKFAPKIVADFGSAPCRVVKIVAVSDDRGLAAHCETDLRQELGAHASVVRSQPYYVDATHQNANKGVVLATLSRHLAIPAGRILTIGDMPSDVLMFVRSGISVAMGNAAPEVKAQAMFVTDSCNDDGFAKAIEKFVLQAPPAAADRGTEKRVARSATVGGDDRTD